MHKVKGKKADWIGEWQDTQLSYIMLWVTYVSSTSEVRWGAVQFVKDTFDRSSWRQNPQVLYACHSGCHVGASFGVDLQECST
jgi:hypothetical protein